MMNFVAVFFLVFLATTQAKSFQHDCNSSNVFMPAALASGVDDLQQLQYCIIDNCTIMRTDNGHQLDIAYTTQSYLVVTPTDGKTSLFISKNEPKQFCYPPDAVILTTGILLTLTAILSGCTVAIFLFLKELRTTFGKLMMLFSIGRTFHSISIVILIITTVVITVNSTMVCYIFWLSLLEAAMITEESIACVLAFLAYIMHSSYKSIEVRKETKKRLFRNCIVYIIGLSLLFNVFMISHDFGTGTYKHAMLPNGHCSFFPGSPYHTAIKIAYANIFLNRFLQIIFLVVYFIYYYKFQNAVKFVRKLATSNRQKDQHYFKLAVVMAATIGLSKFLLALNGFIEYSNFLILVSLFFLLIQQAVIMILMMRSKKTARLCKERFCTTETSP